MWCRKKSRDDDDWGITRIIGPWRYRRDPIIRVISGQDHQSHACRPSPTIDVEVGWLGKLVPHTTINSYLPKNKKIDERHTIKTGKKEEEEEVLLFLNISRQLSSYFNLPIGLFTRVTNTQIIKEMRRHTFFSSPFYLFISFTRERERERILQPL